jgi:Cu(I)/Ag(I) efflux system membrane fusion protein
MTMKRTTTFISLAIAGLLFGTAWLVSTWNSGNQQQPVSRAEKKPETGELPYRSGPYRFDVSVQPETPRVGRNALTVILRTADGDPLDNADIRAVAEMPAMGAMPAMQAPAEMRRAGPGRYEGVFKPSMEGSWPLTLEIQAPDLPKRQISFDLATGREGLQLASGAARTDGNGLAEEAPPGMVTLDARRRQLIGVTTAIAQRKEVSRRIRAVGEIRYDQTRLVDVSLKFDAWVGELYADYVGVHVKEGDPLFTVYGAELLAAQQEYLELKRRVSPSQTLLAAARKRLTLWDITEAEIAALERRGKPFDYVTLYSPLSGTVVERNVVAGSAHKAGMTLLRIVDLSQVWVEADIYEAELPLVQEGMAASITLPYLPGQRFAGTVDFVYPTLDGATRTGRVRLTLPNQNGMLKPEMYAEVTLKADLGERLVVPRESIIIAGKNHFVFEDLGGGRLAPRRVITGQRAGGVVEILEGIEAGDRVVTSGNFLIASESRLKAGLEQW